MTGKSAKAKSQRRRRIPLRSCVVCRQIKPKRELVRIVRAPQGGVQIDETGKRAGRGAYVCRHRACWAQLLDGRVLARALKVTLTPEEREALEAYEQNLPMNEETLAASA